jgi:hypothetical protein
MLYCLYLFVNIKITNILYLGTRSVLTKIEKNILRDNTTLISQLILLFIIMLSVNFFCNISSYDILAYITKNYIALIYYAKIVHLLCQFHAGEGGFSAVCHAIYS